jgi:hypothetical protein
VADCGGCVWSGASAAVAALTRFANNIGLDVYDFSDIRVLTVDDSAIWRWPNILSSKLVVERRPTTR